MNKKLLQSYWPLALFVTLTALIYWGTSQTFYQQDEWQELGLIQGGFITANPLAGFSIWQILLGEGRVLSSVVYYWLFSLFPLQAWPTAGLSILFHGLNSFLVYRLAIRLSQRPIIGWVAAGFFLINAVASQTVIWGAAFATLPAATLILLSISYYLDYLETNQRPKYYWSFGLIFISLSFKEIGLFALLFFPLLSLISGKSAPLLKKISDNVLFLSYGLAVFIFRFIGLAFSDEKVSGFISGGGLVIEKVIFHTILYPLTGLFQTYVPALSMYEFAETLSKIQYPYLVTTGLAEIVPQTIISDFAAVVGTVAVVALAVALNWQQKFSQTRFLFFALALTFLSFIPYIVLDRGGSYMDSRYYYLATVGAGLILGYGLDWLVRYPRLKFLGGGLAIAIGLLIAYSHLTRVNAEIESQIASAKERKAILETISRAYPKLTNPTVFYVTGNRDFYIPDNKVPFQQGLGYTLMVWYFDTGKIPPAYLKEKFIWDIGSQGFRDDQSFGFGFYSDLADLQDALKRYNLTEDNIYSFYYDAPTKVLTDTTAEIRAQL